MEFVVAGIVALAIYGGARLCRKIRKNSWSGVNKNPRKDRVVLPPGL